MIHQYRIIPLVILAAVLGSGPALADKIGDPASALTIKTWIKGTPVDVKDGKNIYVLEFWAALSPACRAAVPKLNELQKKFKEKGVVIVGISDEPPEKVKGFVELSGTEVDYIVAADEKRKTAYSYMVAYGQNGIPYTFVVGKDGKVLWHGYPHQGLEKALDEITSGRYDLARAMKIDAVRAELADYQTLIRHGDPKARELGRKLLAERTNNPVALCDLAYRIVSDVHSTTNRDFSLAQEALDRAQKLNPTNTPPQISLTRSLLLFETGKTDEGLALAKKTIDSITDPAAKDSARIYLNVMEGRLEAERKRKNGPVAPSAEDVRQAAQQ